MKTITFKGVTSGDHVHCNNCGQTMLLPHGADKCPICGFVGCLSWVDNEKQEADIADIPDTTPHNCSLKRSDCTSSQQIWHEDNERYGAMKHSDIYEMCRKVRRQEQAELKKALKAHGGSFSWLDKNVDRYDVDYDVPVIAVNLDSGPMDVVVLGAWLNEYDSINLSVKGSEYGDDVDINVNDVIPGHLCYLIDCMPATAAVNDVSTTM